MTLGRNNSYRWRPLSPLMWFLLEILINRIDFGMDLPKAITSPRASQRNGATTQAEPDFITLPTTPGVCEPVAVDVVLTASPGEVFTIATSGDLCTHFLDGTPTLSASFGAKQVSYSGSHRRARLVGSGDHCVFSLPRRH